MSYLKPAPFSSAKSSSAPPKNYIPGLGRGAAGFTTRSDVGPAVPASAASATTEDGIPMNDTGSRASQARRAAIAAQRQFGAAPQNYVPGAGRGAGMLGGGGDAVGGVGGQYDQFSGYSHQQQESVPGQYDDDDDEADRVWAAVDERMKQKRKRRKTDKTTENDEQQPLTARARIGAQFRDYKEQLASVSVAEWAALPDVGDYSLKYKQQRSKRGGDVFTPLTDSLLEQRSHANLDATASHKAVAGTTTIDSGFKSVVTNMSGLSAARGTVLGMSLDKMATSGETSAAVDPQGYLTSLAGLSSTVNTAAQVSDINKARLLLKSVRDTNPHHGPGWIASARVEEAAGQLPQARKIIQEGCQVCPNSEDVWLEAARLHPHDVAKRILARAVRNIPTSVKIFVKAADLEATTAAKKQVLRKALEANPTSVTLWKAAIDLEEAEDAKILLRVAVEKIPHAVDMWLALARLETYEAAQKVLNKARAALPAERTIWMAAAKLQEGQQQPVEKIIKSAVKSLQKHEAIITRDQWLAEAEAAEASGAPNTAAAIVEYTIGLNVDEQDRQRTWADDAKQTLQRGSVATSRAILQHALKDFPTKRGLWMQAVELERNHGTKESLDKVLHKASLQLPKIVIFWLLRAKEQWLAGNVNAARKILSQAFEENPNSEQVWLAAAKLEWETGEVVRARMLLQRARESSPTPRVYMKSALLEREQGEYDAALKLIEQGIAKYPTFAKLYMMGGQIYAHDNTIRTKETLQKARDYFERGRKACPDSTTLWILASRLEEENADAEAGSGSTKARSLLELARLNNKQRPELWLEAVRLERRSGHDKLAQTLLSKGLQECPTSGLLLAETITLAPRVEQKSKSTVAIKKAPEDPYVIGAVATLFWAESKLPKARKWLDRAVVLQPDLGDAWARYYAFEKSVEKKIKQEGDLVSAAKVKERCIAADPKHGEIWTSVSKDLANRGKTVGELLELAAAKILGRMIDRRAGFLPFVDDHEVLQQRPHEEGRNSLGT